MRWQHQWWGVLLAAVLVGRVGVTAGTAAGAQFLPMLSVREGATRSYNIPRADGYIAYLTLLNERDGGINGVTLVWEECETVFDVARTVECYERLKAKGPTGAAAFHAVGTPIAHALTERTTHDQIPLITLGYGRADAADGRVFPYVFPVLSTWWSQNTAKIRFIGQQAGGMVPAGEAAMGSICAVLHSTGTHFPLIREVLTYVYARGKGPGPPRDVGTVFWIRGLLQGVLTTEALRTAMRHFGHQPLTGAQVQWGLEHLTLTAA